MRSRYLPISLSRDAAFARHFNGAHWLWYTMYLRACDAEFGSYR